MSKKIAIITSGHHADDERLFKKIAVTLSEDRFELLIATTLSEMNYESGRIKLVGKSLNDRSQKSKSEFFIENLEAFNPNLIISAEVMPILPAFKYRTTHPNCKIFYDITEWFPENLRYSERLLDKLKYLFYKRISNRIISKVDGLLYGEQRKINHFGAKALAKPRLFVPYFPILRNFEYTAPNAEPGKLIIAFTGILSAERGLFRLLSAAEQIWQNQETIDLKLLFVGKFISDEEQSRFENFECENKNRITKFDWVSYEGISNSIAAADICVDLREKNFVYSNSLPIKIFEYMAAGKAVIYSDVDAIKEDLQIEKFGTIVNPHNTTEIVDVILEYASDKKMLLRKSKRSRELAENDYNWEKYEASLTEFINSLISS